MSNYESERGTIKLPAAAFTNIRKSFETREKAKQSEAYDHTQRFWKSLTRKQQTDPAEYEKARDAYAESYVRPRRRDVFAQPDATVVEKFEDMTYLPRGWDQQTQQSVFHTKPARVKQSDVDWANNRATVFISGEAVVEFNRDDTTMTWSTGHNNHQVDTARETWLSKAMHDELRKVRWTRGTGGSFTYTSENQEDWGPSKSAGFGPLGFVEAPSMANDYVDTKGVKHSAAANHEQHWKAQAKAAAAYQRSMKQQRKGEQGVPTTNRGHFGHTTRGESSRGLGGGSYLG